MKKKVWRKDGMKMLINTGHKEFDRQTVCISSGQALGSTQNSFCIRPYSETECNGHEFRPGELQNADLNSFLRMPEGIREAVKKLANEHHVILFRFSHWNGFTKYRDGRRIDHGYVAVDSNTNTLIQKFVTGPTMKSHGVIDECIKYITEDGA